MSSVLGCGRCHHGDKTGTQALVEALLLHRTYPTTRSSPACGPRLRPHDVGVPRPGGNRASRSAGPAGPDLTAARGWSCRRPIAYFDDISRPLTPLSLT